MMDKYGSWISDGFGKIADTLKLLLYKENQSLFEKFDFEDDFPFTEPLLISYFNNKENTDTTLEQVLWGYISEKNKLSHFKALSNSKGVLHIPNYGNLLTTHRNDLIDVFFTNEQLVLKVNGSSIDYSFQSIPKIVNTPFTFITDQNQLLDSYFLDEWGKKVAVKILRDPLGQEYIKVALSKIQQCNDPYYKYLLKVVRGMLIYRGLPNSFATLSAHGIAFFNQQIKDRTIFFFDNIVHQCGHIIFNAISFEKEKWFKVPHHTPLGRLNNSSDSVDVYGRYHGLFTQTNVNNTIDKALDGELFEGEELYELVGRFSSNMTRFKVGLDNLNLNNAYTDLGAEWYAHFQSEYERLYDKREKLIKAFKVDNQPYVFNFDVFKGSNQFHKQDLQGLLQ